MKHVDIFTDGACSGNPGPGGYGVILRYKGVNKELSGGEPNTTNNRMELTAVITGLAALKEPCEVTLYSDSRYIIDAIQKGWAKNGRQTTGCATPRNLPSTPTCGNSCSVCSSAIRSPLSGSRVTPVTRKMSAATSWRCRLPCGQPVRHSPWLLGQMVKICEFCRLPLAKYTFRVYN